MNFEMEMLLDDERKEILRILRALTAQTRKHLPLFRAYHVLLVELDWIRAKMQLAVEMEAEAAALNGTWTCSVLAEHGFSASHRPLERWKVIASKPYRLRGVFPAGPATFRV